MPFKSFVSMESSIHLSREFFVVLVASRNSKQMGAVSRNFWNMNLYHQLDHRGGGVLLEFRVYDNYISCAYRGFL
jgi:hypothetical protein